MASASSSPPPSAADASAGAAGFGSARALHKPHPAPRALLFVVLVIATAGLVYELCIAAVASYVLGDSVRQFSLVIGVYLSALGLGAYLSRFIDRWLNVSFVHVELATALVGGLSAPALFWLFAITNSFELMLYAVVLAVGTLVGLELPLLIRILQRDYELKELIARALTFDYAGALVGSVAFSLFLVPRLGLVHTSLCAGLLNAVVALLSTWLLAFDDETERRKLRSARHMAVLAIILLVGLLGFGTRLSELSERAIYGMSPSVVLQTPYQRIVMVGPEQHFQLFLNGNLQFSSNDEYRYHEALVHPAMAAAPHHARVLIGGGGDGLAAREVLRWPGVQAVTLVDLDPQMTDLARHHPALARQNHAALSDPRLSVVNADAMVWFADASEKFDVVILDFPDPTNYSLGKLYSKRFYSNVQKLLAPGATLAVQSTSPLLARSAYWCVVATLESVGFELRPYHVFVPSFGEWGYVLAGVDTAPVLRQWPELGLRFMSRAEFEQALVFPPDMSRVPARVNRLDNQALVDYYLSAWSRFSN